MNAALIDVMAQYEMVLWLKDRCEWVHDAELMQAMQLTRQEIRELRAPLVDRGFMQACVGACRLTDHGRLHAAEILADLAG